MNLYYNFYLLCTLGLHEDSKSSQDTASEKASTVSDEVLTSVRFAKKVVIENSLTVNRSQVIIIHYLKQIKVNLNIKFIYNNLFL